MRRFILSSLIVLLIATAQPGVAVAESVNIVMKTTAGDIYLELLPDAAPVTVENFLNYVDGNHFDNAQFYRVVRMDNQAQNNVKIEVIQGGIDMDGEESAFDAIAHESTETTGILHQDGVISMARLEPGTATSEFFICVNDQPELDYGGGRNPDGQGFAAFGKVVKGMDIVRKIQNMNTDNPPGAELEYTSGQMLIDPVVIYGISRVSD